MSEETEKNTEQSSTVHRIRLKRHLWPEEVQAKKEKRKIQLLKISLPVLLILGLLIGWVGGSAAPISIIAQWKEKIAGSNTEDKIATVLKTMETQWFFGSDIEDLDERLTDQALIGITTNSEDVHTTYMSAEETTDFVQSINRNFVGIGVQFIQSGDLNIVERVFKNSPAEAAGVQAGDVFRTIDGTSVEGLTTTEIKELVLGDEGTEVTIEFQRGEETVTLTITRGAVSATAYGYLLDENTVFLEMYQFGDGTPTEVKNYLEDLLADGKKNLILDLRDNGGGYLTSLSGVASLFLPEDTLVMKQVYSDDSEAEIRTSGEPLENIGDIVILVNESTASAAEVLTLALKEQRENVTIVGTTTYGKGTVQVTKSFSDGSALKYTTSKWVSPSGVWINGVGITPDVEVKLDDAMYHSYTAVEEGESYAYDSVGDSVADAQLLLAYLGYTVDRTDGYFSETTTAALEQYEQDHDLTVDGILDEETYESLYSSVTVESLTNKTHDYQLQKAEEILNG